MSIPSTPSVWLKELSQAANGKLKAINLSEDLNFGLLSLMIQWVMSRDSKFVINGGAGAAHATGSSCTVAVTDASSVIDIFNETATVVVTVTGGTATGVTLNGAASPVTLTMTDGAASLLVKSGAAGTVILGLSGGNTSLDVSATKTVTLS